MDMARRGLEIGVWSSGWNSELELCIWYLKPLSAGEGDLGKMSRSLRKIRQRSRRQSPETEKTQLGEESGGEV